MMRSRTPVRVSELAEEAATCRDDEHGFGRKINAGAVLPAKEGSAGLGPMEGPISSSLLPMIQLAITPVILITGLGSLLLTMTNRMGRIVDRTRILAGQARAAAAVGERAHIESQLRIMYQRAK